MNAYKDIVLTNRETGERVAIARSAIRQFCGRPDGGAAIAIEGNVSYEVTEPFSYISAFVGSKPLAQPQA